MLTIDEQERDAYQRGDTALAALMAALIDVQAALAAAAAGDEEAQDEIAHLKRILRDALADDSWRERARAAIA
jgi:hypothetical protein